MPVFAGVGFVMIGFCTFEVKPAGPVHAHKVAPVPVSIKVRSVPLPSQIGELVEISGIGASNALKVTTAEPFISPVQDTFGSEATTV